MEAVSIRAVPLAVCPPSVPDAPIGPAGSPDVVRALFACVVDLFKIEFTLYGVTFSFWQVFLFTIAASITIWIIKELFLSD